MLTVSGVTKSLGGRTLFADATFSLKPGDRAGLVGANGAGKSTLFRILLGEEVADAGEVALQRGVRLGFLPQEGAPVGDETVMDTVFGWGDVAASGDHRPEIDGEAIGRARRVLRGLAFRESDWDRPLRTFSGGWVMRARLARLLVEAPDLLLLDEPTNHLDLETLLWFQDHLAEYPGGLLMISHDREFLNRLGNQILEIRQERVWRYTGNYDQYLEQREAHREQQSAAWKNQQREIDRLMEFVDRFRAKSSKAAQAQAKLKQIGRIDRVAAPDAADATVDFVFPQPEQSGQRVINLDRVDFSYGSHPIYRGLNFAAERGERMALVGPNGAGKSTLLKLLAGVLTPQSGERRLGLRVRAGYHSQHRQETLDLSRTVLEEALDTPARVTELYVRTLLGCFLFHGDDVHKRVGVLSGGEKSRLSLAKLLLNPPNLLLLDEPTTHLDMGSIDALIAALSEYTGALIFISHDVHFIRSIALVVGHVSGGAVTRFAGDYDYYLEKSGAASARAGLTAGALAPRDFRPGAATVVDSGAESTARQSARERRQRAAEARRVAGEKRREARQWEDKVTALEGREAALTETLQRPETYANPRSAQEAGMELTRVREELKTALDQWETAATEAAALEGAAPESET